MTSSRLLFFGTPEFAVPALETAASIANIEVVGVITQPDQPSGRGQKLTSSPVKICAESLSIPVFQPERLRGLKNVHSIFTTDEKDSAETVRFAAWLSSIGEIDLALVVAYGKIIPLSLLTFPKLGMLNLHGSLLPRWRGAAPIHRALMAGDAETGICLMGLEEGLDTGPVYARVTTAIAADETFGSLHDRMSQIGASLLREHLLEILSGKLKAVPQSEVGVTYAEKWTREESVIKWSESAAVIERRIRVSNPHPGAAATLDNELLKIFRAHPTLDRSLPWAEPGTVVESNRAEVIVACGEGEFLSLDEVQFAGRKRLPIAEVLKSRAIERGSKLRETLT